MLVILLNTWLMDLKSVYELKLICDFKLVKLRFFLAHFNKFRQNVVSFGTMPRKLIIRISL